MRVKVDSFWQSHETKETKSKAQDHRGNEDLDGPISWRKETEQFILCFSPKKYYGP